MFFDHLICADCGSDNIQSNGDNDCCCDCGSHNYEEVEEETDDEQPIPPDKLIADMFASWVPIFGGKQ